MFPGFALLGSSHCSFNTSMCSCESVRGWQLRKEGFRRASLKFLFFLEIVKAVREQR